MRLLYLIGCLLLGTAACAQNLTRDTIPGKWLDPLLPEDLPKLKYPSYANALDRARMEINSGRYKLGLITLKKAGDADAVQVAILKGTALQQTGRREQAIQILSQGPAAKDGRAQVLRADILVELGKLDDAIAIANQHLKEHADSVPGHFELGRLKELKGDYHAARDAYKCFVDEPQHFLDRATNDTLHTDSAEELTYIGRGLDRW